MFKISYRTLFMSSISYRPSVRDKNKQSIVVDVSFRDELFEVL